MTTPAKKAPTDWERIEIDFRAGAKSTREIAAEHGISHTAINKRARDHGWTRDLSMKIKAKADEKVSRAQVSREVSAETKITEAVTVEVEAKVQARIRLAHRTDLGRTRKLAMELLAELESQTSNTDAYEALLDALAEHDGAESEEGKTKARTRLWEQWQRAMTLGPRTDTAKKLAETLRILIDKEREAFGIKDDQQAPNSYEEALRQLKQARAPEHATE